MSWSTIFPAMQDVSGEIHLRFEPLLINNIPNLDPTIQQKVALALTCLDYAIDECQNSEKPDIALPLQFLQSHATVNLTTWQRYSDRLAAGNKQGARSTLMRAGLRLGFVYS